MLADETSPQGTAFNIAKKKATSTGFASIAAQLGMAVKTDGKLLVTEKNTKKMGRSCTVLCALKNGERSRGCGCKTKIRVVEHSTENKAQIQTSGTCNHSVQANLAKGWSREQWRVIRESAAHGEDALMCNARLGGNCVMEKPQC